MYFVIVYILVFFTLKPVLKKLKGKENTKSLELSKEFLCENENIIKYNFYSDNIIYTVLMLVIFAIYGLISLIFPTLLSKYSLFNIFTYIISLVFIIISIILSIKIRFSEILIISNIVNTLNCQRM